MRKSFQLAASLLAAGAFALPFAAQAHCDSLDGPVATAALRALDLGNVNIILPYAPASAEAEMGQAFDAARKVRAMGADARRLADRSFLETAVRLHRAGEGACFSGLKPAGLDHGPVIPAAESALASGDAAKLRAALQEEIDHALTERLGHARGLQGAPAEAHTAAEVPRARERIREELGFVTWAEGIRQAALGRGAGHED